MKPRVTCPHGDLAACTSCLAVAHTSAVGHLRALLHATPSPVDDADSRLAVKQRLIADVDDAMAAHAGFIVLRENGIALWQRPNLGCSHVRCIACTRMGPADAPCRFNDCPGRRLRFQPPEVRGR